MNRYIDYFEGRFSRILRVIKLSISGIVESGERADLGEISILEAWFEQVKTEMVIDV